MQKPVLQFDVCGQGAAFGVELRGRPVSTLAGKQLVLPTHDAAQALAAQMATQAKEAPLYRLASLWIDKVSSHETEVIGELDSFLDTDMLCYRATDPADLVTWQQNHWNPVLVWTQTQGVFDLQTTTFTAPVTHGKTAHEAVCQKLAALSSARLTCVLAAARLANSTLLGWAFGAGHLDAEALFKAACADDLYQQNRYGVEPLHQARLDLQQQHFKDVEYFRTLIAENL